MDLIYSTKRKPLKCEPPYFDSATDPELVRPLVTISSANIIAFTSLTELHDIEGDTWGGHVYVCDLDTPWDSHKVTSTAYPVSALEWDVEGNKLVVATTVGEVSVFAQKEYLLNLWQCLYSASFPGEHIIRCAFFHNGRRLVVHDKKPEGTISERVQLLRHAPTLKGFGGVPLEGCVVVTQSGLVGVAIHEGAPAPAPTTTTATHSLRPTRDHVTHAAITYAIDGKIMLSVVCRRLVVHAACVVSRAPPAITLQPLPAVASSNPRTSCVWWWNEALAVAGGAPGGASGGASGGATGGVELWRCTDKQHPLHDVLHGVMAGNTTPGGGQKPNTEFFSTVGWAKGGSWGAGGAIRAGAGGARGVAGPAVALTAGAALLLQQDTPRICTRQILNNGANSENGGGSSPKKIKFGPGGGPGAGGAVLCDVSVSWLGGVCVCVDTRADLHVLAVHKDLPGPLGVAAAASQLETALVAGYCCLDVVMCAKPDRREAIYERITESFQRQPPHFQQHYHQNWLKIRIALARSSPSLQPTAHWLTCMLTCHAVLAACCAAQRAAPDAAVDVTLDNEDDKSVAALEAKPESILGVEPATLGGLRLGLQRAADVAFTALLALPIHHHHHGFEIWTEGGSVSLLRRLVAAWRGAAPQRADGIARLLHNVAQRSLHKQEAPEECLGLAATSGHARVWECLPRVAVSAPHGAASATPFTFKYGVEPEALRYNPEPPAYANSYDTTPSNTMDSIRYMYLGGGARPARYRACGRCGARALAAPVTTKHPLQRAYDARFLPYCRCGGKWTLCTNI